MKADEADIISYQDVLEQIEDQHNHLLLGNGFNRGLGVNTSYKAIFEKMIELNPSLYDDARSKVSKYNYDLEKFIGCLESDIDENNDFLRKYVRNKVKFDFMKATHQIVKSEIKNVYAENNEGVFILLKNFANFFTLNYDSFLYLLLLHYKRPSDEIGSIALQLTIKSIEEEIDERQNDIYKEIKHIRKNGILEITVSNSTNNVIKGLNKLTQAHFVVEVTGISKAQNKGWKTKDIERVVKYILEEEKRNQYLNKVDDGSRQMSIFEDDCVFDDSITSKNLFFLHGAFHIYRDRELEKKITKETDKALYDRLEKILNDEEQEIICIFRPENKLDEIEESNYLKNNLKKLAELSGNMVIIGSSLDENDKHIFERINDSDIDTLFISAMSENKSKIREAAQAHFPSKSIHIFDADSISYKLPKEIDEEIND